MEYPAIATPSPELPRLRDTGAMGDVRAAELLTLARELEQHDRDVAARIETIVHLLEQVDDARARARKVRGALAAMPEQVEHAEQAARDAGAREDESRRELADAERRLGEVGRSRRAGEDAKAAAERAVRRATVALTDAAATAARMRARLTELASDEVALRAEGEGLVVEARDVARAVADLPRISDSGRAEPGTTLGEIEHWGARAHAALFVVRGGLENERERIVLEANGLAAAVLGDHVGGASVALVRRRLELSLSDS
jgi:chromosome segregation ATPase